ncbi:MAG: ATP-grasp domain-containing protein, partial [Desulfurobacteriaceae bacterium]
GITLFRGDEIPPVEFPCIVKPCRAGSSVGVSLVKSPEAFAEALKRAFEFDSKVLIEELLEGKELTVAVLNGKALPPVEIIPAGEFYDYSSKYEDSKTRYEVPAQLPEKLEKKLRKIAERAYKVLECRGAVRVDFKLDKYSSPYVLEVNTIPGLTERSLLPKAAAAAGITFEKLIERMLEG